MKKILIILFLLACVVAAWAQPGTTNTRGMRFTGITDSTTVVPGDAFMYYNAQHVPPKFRVYENGTWKDLFGPAGNFIKADGTTSIGSMYWEGDLASTWEMVLGDNTFTNQYNYWEISDNRTAFQISDAAGVTQSRLFMDANVSGKFSIYSSDWLALNTPQIQWGNGVSGTTRTFTALGTGADVGFTFAPKGAGRIKTPNLDITSAPANDDALTQILARDATTGEIKYRSAGTIGSTVTASNGLTKVGSDIQLGGPIQSNRSMTYNDPGDVTAGDVTNTVQIGNAGSFQFEALNVSSASGGNGIVFFDNQESQLTINPNKFQSGYFNNTSGESGTIVNGVAGIELTATDASNNYTMLDISTPTSSTPQAEFFLNDATTASNHTATFALTGFNFNFQDASNNDAATLTLDATGIKLDGHTGGVKLVTAPASDDTETAILVRDATTGAIETRSASSLGSSLPDTDVKFFEQEEWFASTLISTGWQGSSSGAGSGTSGSSQYGVNATEHAFGVFAVTAGTDATASSQIFRNSFLLGNGNEIRLRGRIAVGALSDGTNSFTTWWGFRTSTAGTFFRYTHTANGGRYECVTSTASTETISDSGVTVDTNYHILEMVIAGDLSQVQFYIDGNLVATNTTNVPTNSDSLLWQLLITKTAGTSARSVYIDWHDLTLSRTVAR